jgi:O-succinylhomoserine sulfhydrylase
MESVPNDVRPETMLVRCGTIRSGFGEMSEAVYLNSAYCFSSAEEAEGRFNRSNPGYTYSRYSNPNIDMLERRLAALEGAEGCLAVSSGMAAVFAALMCFLRPGDHVVANRVLFGSCYYIVTQVLPRFNIDVTLVDGGDNDAWDKAFRDETKAVFVETPSNPTLELVDVAHVASLCKRYGARFLVDNVFAGPLAQRPLELGADVVIYSTTKHMDGQGRTLGGAILGDSAFINDLAQPFCRHTGPGLSPFNAWIVFKALETFALRTERHTENAVRAAEFLEGRKEIARVHYPYLSSHPQYALAKRQMKNGGALVSFELKGGKEQAFSVLNRLKLISIANNLGDTRSLINHPASTTHASIPKADQEKIGLKPGLLRLSVGIEHIDDILADLEGALGG